MDFQGVCKAYGKKKQKQNISIGNGERDFACVRSAVRRYVLVAGTYERGDVDNNNNRMSFSSRFRISSAQRSGDVVQRLSGSGRRNLRSFALPVRIQDILRAVTQNEIKMRRFGQVIRRHGRRVLHSSLRSSVNVCFTRSFRKWNDVRPVSIIRRRDRGQRIQ